MIIGALIKGFVIGVFTGLVLALIKITIDNK